MIGKYEFIGLYELNAITKKVPKCDRIINELLEMKFDYGSFTLPTTVEVVA